MQYPATNSGARIGLIDDLKPKFRVAFKNAENPTLGYEYLYLTEADYPQASPLLQQSAIAKDITR